MPIHTESLGVALGIFNYLLKRYMWSVFTTEVTSPHAARLWGTHSLSVTTHPGLQAPDIQE